MFTKYRKKSTFKVQCNLEGKIHIISTHLHSFDPYFHLISFIRHLRTRLEDNDNPALFLSMKHGCTLMSAAVDAAPCAVRLHAVRSNHSSVCKFLTAVVNTGSKQPHKVHRPESNHSFIQKGWGGGGSKQGRGAVAPTKCKIVGRIAPHNMLDY